jgi:hypothetical protein
MYFDGNGAGGILRDLVTPGGGGGVVRPVQKSVHMFFLVQHSRGANSIRGLGIWI